MKRILFFGRIILLTAITLSSFAQHDKVIREIIEIGKNDNRTMEHLDILCNLHFATPSYTAGTKGVQTGHVPIEPKTQDEFDRMKGKLKGAWVLISGESDGFIEQMAKERQNFLLEFDIRNHFKLGPVKYHNVIGIIRGAKHPEELVIMGGRLDSCDVATGGVDDGSGATPAMEAARLIMAAGGKPDRTILVCMWAGEEFGINPDFPFVIEKREPRKRPKQAWGTDSGPFAVEGVPTMTFNTEDPKGYDFSYREIWHTERDLYNKSIAEYQEHTAIVTAVVVYGIANLKHLLSREGYYLPEEEDQKP